MKTFRHQTQKAITTRFSMADYLQIQRKAEDLGINLAEMIRISWQSYQESSNLKSDLSTLEYRIVAQVFEVCCAVNGLNPQEKIEAQNELIEQLKRYKK